MIAPQIESSSDIPSQIEPIPAKPYINRANAQELARRSHEARRLAKSIAESPEAKALQSEAKPLPESFEATQLAATRARIKAVYSQLAGEEDADLSFKLGCLLKKLWEIYQLLAQVPGPGTRKPKPERSQRGSGSTFEPVEE